MGYRKCGLTLFGFLLISTYAFSQGSIFEANIFLLDNCTKNVYKDKHLKVVYKGLSNDTANDRYYLFRVLPYKYNKSVKVQVRYTIDANSYSSEVLNGWVDLNHLGLYYLHGRELKPYVYTSSNRGSKKILFSPDLLKTPLKIFDVLNQDGDMWCKVKIDGAQYGWIPPELQCADIWNACAGN